MVISNVVGHQYAFLLPVGLVIVCAVLVFAFGFKSSVEPPSFKQLSISSDERKSLKRKKLKEKKAQFNGHVTVIIDENEGKTKPLKQSNKADTNKVKKVEDVKKDNQKSPAKVEKKIEKRSGKENQETPKKKKNERVLEDKPSDFDDGEWETAFSRKDKKNKKKEDDGTPSSPEKTPKKKTGEKKSPKQEKISDEKTQKKSNQTQNRTPASSPGGKKSGEQKEAGSKSSQEKKNKSNSAAIGVAKLPLVESKQQQSALKEKKQTGSNSPAKSATQKPSKVKESGDNQAKSEAVLKEHDNQWKEAQQKKSKKKVRKD